MFSDANYHVFAKVVPGVVAGEGKDVLVRNALNWRYYNRYGNSLRFPLFYEVAYEPYMNTVETIEVT